MSDAPPNTEPNVPSAAAGWYPAGDGSQRYWDGTTWTEHVTAMPPPGPEWAGGMSPAGAGAGLTEGLDDERTIAALIHGVSLFSSFLGPLILWLIKRDDSSFVDDQGKEVLNFQITMFIAFIVAIPLIFVIVGLILLPILFIVNIVFPILGAIAASRGERYRYPFALRLIS